MTFLTVCLRFMTVLTVCLRFMTVLTVLSVSSFTHEDYCNISAVLSNSRLIINPESRVLEVFVDNITD